jgi:DNA-binding GntR family transcriptional regulator
MPTNTPSRTRTSRTATTPPAAPGEGPRGTWQRVAEGLQVDIISGGLQPREHLVEDEVMRRFGASRYAVRRAFEELQSLGLATRTENRGTRIRGYTPDEVADLYDMRELLETGAVLRIPVPVATELIDELVRIQKQHDTAARRKDLYRLHTANDEFHRTLFGACPNALLTEAIANYSLQVQPVRMRFVHDERRRVQAGQEHWEMIDALKADDLKALARACGRHLSLSKAAYLKVHGLVRRAATGA